MRGGVHMDTVVYYIVFFLGREGELCSLKRVAVSQSSHYVNT